MPVLIASAIGATGSLTARVAAAQRVPPPPLTMPTAVGPYQRARRLVEDGQGALGRALADSLVAASPAGSPALAEALWWRATLSADGARAEQDLRRIVDEFASSPRVGDATVRLAQLDLARDRPDVAEPALARLVRERPSDPARAQAAYWLARARLELGDTRGGCTALADAVSWAQSYEGYIRQQATDLRARMPACDPASVVSAMPPLPPGSRPATPPASRPVAQAPERRDLPPESPREVAAREAAPREQPPREQSPRQAAPREPAPREPAPRSTAAATSAGTVPPRTAPSSAPPTSTAASSTAPSSTASSGTAPSSTPGVSGAPAAATPAVPPPVATPTPARVATAATPAKTTPAPTPSAATPAPSAASTTSSAATAAARPTATPPSAAATANGAYAVQVAAYGQRDGAETLAAHLRTRGFEARATGSVAPFRVKIGHYATRTAAAAARTTLAGQGLAGFVTDAGDGAPAASRTP